MREVASVKLWGPYDDGVGDTCEKVMISRLDPPYNINSSQYEYRHSDAPVLHEEPLTFDGYDALKKYFHTLPDERISVTFTLPAEDKEVLDLLTFYCHENKSALVQELLHDALMKRAIDVGRPDIYAEAHTILLRHRTRLFHRD